MYHPPQKYFPSKHACQFFSKYKSTINFTSIKQFSYNMSLSDRVVADFRANLKLGLLILTFLIIITFYYLSHQHQDFYFQFTISNHAVCDRDNCHRNKIKRYPTIRNGIVKRSRHYFSCLLYIRLISLNLNPCTKSYLSQAYKCMKYTYVGPLL